MSSSKGIPFFLVWVDDSIRMITIPGEHPSVTGARFNLWLAAATGEVGPVGILPDDDRILQPLSRLSLDEWQQQKSQVVRSWRLLENKWVIERLAKESARQSKRAQKARRSGRLGGLAKASKGNGKDLQPSERLANASPMLEQKASERLAPYPIRSVPILSEEEEKKRSSPLTPLTTGSTCSPWLSPEQEQELFSLSRLVKEKYPEKTKTLDEVIEVWRSQRKSWLVVRKAMMKVASRDPVISLRGYLTSIISGEEEALRRQAEDARLEETFAEHQALKEQDALQAGPRIDRGFESTGEILARAGPIPSRGPEGSPEKAPEGGPACGA